MFFRAVLVKSVHITIPVYMLIMEWTVTQKGKPMLLSVADPENFGGGDFKHKTSKIRIRMSSPKLRVIFRPKSEIQTFFSPKIRWSPKKKKKVFTRIESDFSAGFVTFRLVGGDASRNGAELFEIEADFSAKIVTFRLVGGMHPPIPPPKSATGCYWMVLLMYTEKN